MRAREYTRKIKIFETETISDGFGGNIAQDVLIGSYWARVKQNSAYKDNSIGKSDIKKNYTFNIRANDKITIEPTENNLSIEYKGVKYFVNDIRYSDELFRFIDITANAN
jgi:SPP1 family predicted phage head-tail adaptor